MGFTSDACWFLLIKSNKKRDAALKNEAGGDEKHVFFLVGLKLWRHATAKHWNTLPRDTRSMADSKNF